MNIFRMEINNSESFIGVLDAPRGLTKIGENFEIRGWICGVGSPAVVKIRSSKGMSLARHVVRLDVNRHIANLRTKTSQHLFVYAFSSRVVDLDSFELIVESSLGSATWIRASNVSQEFQRGLEEATDFFSDSDFLSNLRWTEDSGPHFEVGGKPRYFVLGSVEDEDKNYILLRDGHEGAHYILVQRVIASELLIQVESEDSKVLHPQFAHVDENMRHHAIHLSQKVREELGRLPATNPEKPVFGIGKLSLNHYFYETLPGLLSLSLKLHSSIPKLLVNRDREFFDTQLLLEGAWTVSNAHANDTGFFALDQSPVILAGQNLFQIGNDEREKLDRSIVFQSNGINYADRNDQAPTIWFDTSTSNRNWNMEEVFCGLMSEFLTLFENPTFVLDGLTARWDEHRSVFIPDWISTIPGIERANVIPLNFARADEKIRWAFQVNFYFASYTTGSMFVHRFSAAPGIAMSAPRTLEHPRIHLFESWRKIIIPTSLFDSQDLEADPAWADFQVNTEAFIPWAVNQALKFLPTPTAKAQDRWIDD